MTTKDVNALLERLDQVLEPPVDDDDAVAAIEEVVALPDAADHVWVPELLWQLGQAHARAGRYDDAIAAQERAIAAGEGATPDPRATIGAYHLQAGRREVAAGIFAELREQHPDDPWLFNSVGMDYQDVGDHQEAVRWLDQGLRLAIESDVDELVGQLANLRRDSLAELGRELDDDLDAAADAYLEDRRARDQVAEADRKATLRPPLLAELYGGDDSVAELFDDVVGDVPVGRTPTTGTGRPLLALAWFPEEELPEALERWPELDEHWDGDDYRSYVRALQGHLLGFTAAGSKPLIAPLTVEGLRRWARQDDRDPGARSSRATYAATVAQRGDAVAWPPGRNDPCWCGSGTKYKRCCGTVDRPDLDGGR